MDDERWWMEVPERPMEFWKVVNNLKASVALEGGSGQEEEFGVPLTASEYQHVTECFKRAEAYYEAQQAEAAWYFVSLAKGTISYRNGFLAGKHASSDEAGSKRVASRHGKTGAEVKAAKRQIARKEVVDELLAQHSNRPFQNRRQMRDAALRHAPGGGKEERDEGWWRRLLKAEPALKSLYETLSRRRTP